MKQYETNKYREDDRFILPGRFGQARRFKANVFALIGFAHR